MKFALALAAVIAPALPVEAHAQTTYRVRAGLGVQSLPEFPGAGSNQSALYPKVSVKKGDDPFDFSAPDDNFDIALVSSRDFKAGPVLSIEGSRKQSEVGAPVGKVPTTFEAGAFAQYDVGPSFRLRGELRRGIGGHDGIVGGVGGDYVLRDGDEYLVSIGPRLLFSSARYQRAYYGVSDQSALASGLEPYRPGGGLHAVAVTSGLDYRLGGGWGLFGYARYERLVGDVRKSPIVRELGSPNQYSAGIGINRTFTIRL